MKKITLLVFVFSFLGLQAQDKDKEDSISKETQHLIEQIRLEKANLKVLFKEVDAKLEAGEISREEARELKEDYAEDTADRIEDLTEESTEKIEELVEKIVDNSLHKAKDRELTISIPLKKEKKESKPKRTVDRFVFAYGLNNVIDNTKTGFAPTEDLDYKVWQSRYVELGWAFKTRLLEKTSLLNLKYGVSFMWDKYSPKDNKYHVDTDNVTSLIVHSETLKRSKLRSSYAVVPVYLEFDFSKPKIEEDKKILRRNQSARLGLGGYAGVRMNTKQFLKYDSGSGNVKERISADYNMKDFKYGLSAYLGYEDMSFFVNYDLNPLFKNTNYQSVAMGVRFDW